MLSTLSTLIGQVIVAPDMVSLADDITTREGLFAAMLVVVLVFLGVILWKLGIVWATTSRESSSRIAHAVETQAEANVTIMECAATMNRHVEVVQQDVAKVRKSLHIAFQAIREPDEQARHRLIDDARRELEN